MGKSERPQYKQREISRETSARKLVTALLKMPELRQSIPNTEEKVQELYVHIQNAVAETVKELGIGPLPKNPGEGVYAIAKSIYETGLQEECSNLITDMEKEIKAQNPNSSLRGTVLDDLRTCVNNLKLRASKCSDIENHETSGKKFAPNIQLRHHDEQEWDF